MDKPSDTLRFDGWTLDKVSGDLTKDGVTTRLEIRPLLALLELIEHRGEVVTREQLYARLWPKGVVEFDSSLNTAMRKVRLALKDEHDKPRYIETIQRRGYRFLAQLDSLPVKPDVEIAPPPAPLPTRRVRPWYLIGGLCLAVVIVAATLLYFRQADTGATPALAVLPFVAVSGENDSALSLGITEELSNRLSQLSTIKVVARTSASQFAGKNVGAREIGLALGVTHLVEGTVGRDKDVIRVSVKLVSTDTGFDLYTQSFEFPRGAELDIERSLVQAVVTALRVRLSPEIVRRWEARDSRSRLAFDYYLRARQYGHQHTPDGNDQSAALYRLAIEQDPQFALAYVGLAESLLSSVSERGVRIAEISPEVSRLLSMAEEITSELPELLAAKGWLASELGDYPAAITHLHAALKLNPSDAVSSARLGNVYDALGQPRDALENYTRAAELDPYDFLPQLYRCLELQELGRFDEAERACAQTRAQATANYWGPFATSLLKYGRGDLPEAIYWTNEASKLEPSQSGVVNFRIELLLTLGLPQQARESAASLVTTDDVQMWRINASLALLEHGEAGLRSFLERGGELEFTDMDGLVDVARFQHTVGNLAEARKALQKAFELPGFNERELVKPEQILAGYSPAVICAGLLLATGERDHALKLLGDLDEMLDRMERNGWASHGLYSLRAESLALRGQDDAAMQSLNRAVSRGWRQAWRAQAEPYLASLRGREDFKALMKDVEARNASMRARYLKTVTVTAQ